MGSKGFSLAGSRRLVSELRLQIRSSILFFFFLHFNTIHRYFGVTVAPKVKKKKKKKRINF